MPEREVVARDFASHWASAFAECLGAMTGEAVSVGTLSAYDGPLPDGALCWGQSFSAAPGPSLWIAAPEQAWQTLASWVFDAAGLGAAEPDDARKTYFEILSQSLGSTVRWLSSHLGLQVTLADGGVVESTDPAASRFAVEFSGAAAGPLFLAISDRLLDGFTPQPGSTTAAHPNPTALAVLSDLPSGPRTLDLLLDVELPVSVSFGRSRLPVKDVLKLVTGSVIELNRTTNEPVEVLVNHCIVARGEVVVVDGNYGVRITQIVSRQDRLRSAEC